jgi:hypothetical protein
MEHPINSGTGVLCIESSELMDVINLLEQGFSVINKEELSMTYLLHLSDGSNLISYQEPWKGYAQINDSPF